MDGMSGAVSKSLKAMRRLVRWESGHATDDSANTEAAKLITLELPYLSISCYVR